MKVLARRRTLTPAAVILPIALFQATADEPDLGRKLLGLTDEMRVQLEEAAHQGLMEIAPVNVPVDPAAVFRITRTLDTARLLRWQKGGLRGKNEDD